MEIVYFTITGILLYALSDRILLVMERRHGKPLAQRNMVFFVILLCLALASFTAIRSIQGLLI